MNWPGTCLNQWLMYLVGVASASQAWRQLLGPNLIQRLHYAQCYFPGASAGVKFNPHYGLIVRCLTDSQDWLTCPPKVSWGILWSNLSQTFKTLSPGFQILLTIYLSIDYVRFGIKLKTASTGRHSL